MGMRPQLVLRTGFEPAFSALRGRRVPVYSNGAGAPRQGATHRLRVCYPEPRPTFKVSWSVRQRFLGR